MVMDPPPSKVEFKQFELSENSTEKWIIFYKIVIFLHTHVAALKRFTCPFLSPADVDDNKDD